MTEEQLLQTAARLGRDALAGLDSERIAQTVLARLATEPDEAVRPVRRMAPRVVAILAAAAAILLVIRLSVGTVPT
ncbi:MAG TPA: hypothetical protein VGP61_06215, partial [Gemmatimonadales bacterium]|nr:hypothetical protein [Gemmatimonadales bacterium]